jgi:diaminohydroxyphosphoribosylaminopyrimidine deaminase / 5-amino-6-(5-phosphoribosylamino)uracil reductase
MDGLDDERWMRVAVQLAWLCPPSDTAYSVGAVIVGADGTELSRGFSREDGDPHVHAEESALGKLPADDPRLRGATIYSTLEPCSRRRSRPRSCTQLIIAAGLARVVIAWREPSLFVADCQGIQLLEEAGLSVAELPGFAERAAAPNRHLAILAERRGGAPPRAGRPPAALATPRHGVRAACDICHFLMIAVSSTATGR